MSNWLSTRSPGLSEHLNAQLGKALQYRAEYNAIAKLPAQGDTLRTLQWKAIHTMSGVQLCRKADRLRLNRIIAKLKGGKHE